MKTSTLRILNENLTIVQKNIDNHKESFDYVSQYPAEFHKDAEEVLREKLSFFNKQKLELLDCIDWVKSVQTKDLVTKRTKQIN